MEVWLLWVVREDDELDVYADVDTPNWSHNPFNIERFSLYLPFLYSDSISKPSIIFVAFQASSNTDFTCVIPSIADNVAFGSSLSALNIDCASLTSAMILLNAFHTTCVEILR